MIITFLALLELIKQRIFSVNQDELFTDVTITKYTPSVAVIEEVPDEEEADAEEAEEDDNDDEDDDSEGWDASDYEDDNK
ncbi:hypothetical protein IPM19_02070 [bacterium]|nr:MAG: hypothetical protein IPM19_02070 [bacterium]